MTIYISTGINIIIIYRFHYIYYLVRNNLIRKLNKPIYRKITAIIAHITLKFFMQFMSFFIHTFRVFLTIQRAPIKIYTP